MKVIGVRIPNAENLDSQLLLEQLRYAGVIGRFPLHVSSGKMELVYPPAGVDKEAWASQNTLRIQSFGIKAEIIRE